LYKRNGRRESNLQRRDMRVEELISRYVILRELNADIGMNQTSGYLVPTPRSGDMVP